MSHPVAARKDDEIAHSNANQRFLAKVVGTLAGAAALGALCAGAISAAVAAGVAGVGTVVTGGLAAPILAGAVVATGFLVTMAVSTTGSEIGEKVADWLVPEKWEVTGKITTGSHNVFINHRPAARATDKAPLDVVVCGKHASRVPNLIAQGAAAVPQKTVINNALASRKGDKVVCGATISSGSENVFIGGPPATVREFDDEVHFLLRAAMKVLSVRALLKNLGCAWKLLKDPKSVVKNVECVLKLGQAAAGAYAGISAATSNPVHLATGAKLLGGPNEVDFVLPSAMPIVWQRTYNSLDTRQGGPLGQGWSTPYTMELRLGSNAQAQPIVTYFDADGRDIEFPAPEPGEGHFSVAEGIGLMCSEGGAYIVVTDDGRYHSFGPASDANPQGVLCVQRIEDRNGHAQALRYDAQHRLYQIADSTGRLLEFTYHGDTPQLLQIALAIGAANESPEVLARYRHDTGGQLTEVTDRTGQITRRFAYTQSYLSSHQLPTGLQCHYRWGQFEAPLGRRPGPHVRVVQHWTNDGEQSHFSYDLSQAPQQGSTQVTDTQGRTQRWDWNADHEITAYTDALGQTSTQTWSDTKQLLSHTDPLGHTTTWTYDTAGNPTSTTDPLGQSEHMQWSPAPVSLLTAQTDASGASWKYHYDDAGNLTQEVDPLGQSTRYANNEHGLPVVITDANGGRKQLQWDPRGLLVRYTDCSGKATRYTYDPHGHPLQEIDALGQATTLEHDAQGRLLKLQLPDGGTHQYQYNTAGQCVIATDALGHSTSYSYNLRGQLAGRTKTVGRLTSNVQLGYDSAQRLSALVNENRQTYQFAYDAAGRLVMETRIDGTRQVLHYDAAGQVIGVTEHPMPMGQGDAVPGHADVQPIYTQLVRDAAGQLIQKNIYTPSTAPPAATDPADAQPHPPVLQTQLAYRYSPTGHLLQAQQFNPLGALQSQQTWQYDPLGQVLQESAEHTVQGLLHSSILHHEYDALGNHTATRLPDGRTLQHLHYGSGHLHQINLDGAVLADIERDDLHREVLRTQGRLASRYAYDAVGRKAATWVRPAMLRVGHGIGNDQHASAAWSPHSSDWSQRLQRRSSDDTLLKRYSYDKNGELTSAEHSQQGHTRHHYDQAGRITHTLHTGAAQQPSRDEHLHYDLAGNRISALEESSLSTQARGWVQNNRVKVLQDKRYDYDGFGRLIRKRIGSHTEQHYRYNHQHQLIQVAVVRSGKEGQSQSQVFAYQYDALGRRIAKTDSFGSTLFTWQGMRLLQECRGAHTSTYVYEPGSYAPLARIDGAGALAPHPAAARALGADPEQGKRASVPITNPDWPDRFHVAKAAAAANDGLAKVAVGEQVSASPAAQVYYFHTQPSGLPEELSDNGGNLVWTAQYSTWGSTLRETWHRLDAAGSPQEHSHSNAQPLQQNLRMQGQYLDRETGLHYNTFRYYDADLGAFTTPDPIGLNGGLNLHQYAPNPISWIDPWGWAKECGQFNRWKRGDAIDKPLPNGKNPEWGTVRQRYWKNRAESSKGTGEFDAKNMARMQQGKAPLDKNGNPMELHHHNPQRDGGRDVNNPRNLREVTREQHEKLDPYRHL